MGCRRVGAKIARFGIPAKFCPLTVVFTGKGNVSLGAQEIFDLLPVKRVCVPCLASWSLCCLLTCLLVAVVAIVVVATANLSCARILAQVSPGELKAIREGKLTGPDFDRVIYVAVATSEHMVELAEGHEEASSGGDMHMCPIARATPSDVSARGSFAPSLQPPLALV